MSSFRKNSGYEFGQRLKEIKSQLCDQVKLLEQKTEIHSSILNEVNDFLKKRMEIDLEYSRHLEKLARSFMLKHKSEKSKRASWPIFSTCTLWQQLVDDTKEEARQRNIAAEIYANHVIPNIVTLTSIMQRVNKKCRDVCSLAQGEVIRVLSELQVSMGTYHLCYSQFDALSSKLHRIQVEKNKASISSSSRKQRSMQKLLDKRAAKFDAAKVKCDRARNEYLLSRKVGGQKKLSGGKKCIEAANTALFKFFAEDLSDLVDCSNLGIDYWMGLIVSNIISARKSICCTEMNSLAELGSFKDSLQSQNDKNRFFENNNSFILQKRFDFKCAPGDSTATISIVSGLSEEFRQRVHQIRKRLSTLKAESDISWNTMEQNEKFIRDALNSCTLINVANNGSETLENRLQNETENELAKSYDTYIQNFSFYLFNANLISRLEARAEAIGQVLTSSSPRSIQTEKESFGESAAGGSVNSDVPSRKKRIGSQTSTTIYKDNHTTNFRRPRLFNGSLEEYCEVTGENIPLIVISCIRVLSKYALHHQGLFRISGSQIEINNYKESFENGDDPLLKVKSASDANSIASTLKLYLREQQPPLFPFYLFELITDCSKCTSTAEFVNKISPLLNKLPRPTYLLLRYLFGFLRHLSEFSDENMMDPYNIAICFGPTLLPIPEGKDQVTYQNSVNDVVKNFILHYELVFSSKISGPRYERYSSEILSPETPVDVPSESFDISVCDSEMDPFSSTFNEPELCDKNLQELSMMLNSSVNSNQPDKRSTSPSAALDINSGHFHQNMNLPLHCRTEAKVPHYCLPNDCFSEKSEKRKTQHLSFAAANNFRGFQKLDLNDNLPADQFQYFPKLISSSYYHPTNATALEPSALKTCRMLKQNDSIGVTSSYLPKNRPELLRIPVAPKPVSRTMSEDPPLKHTYPPSEIGYMFSPPQIRREAFERPTKLQFQEANELHSSLTSSSRRTTIPRSENYVHKTDSTTTKEMARSVLPDIPNESTNVETNTSLQKPLIGPIILSENGRKQITENN